VKPAFRAALAIFVKILSNMEKRVYEAPATGIVEVAIEGVIAYSGENTEQYQTYGTTYTDSDFE